MQCGIEIEKTFNKAGVPDGVFQTIVGDSSAAEILIDSDGISAITLTGSVPAGAKVAHSNFPDKEDSFEIRRK